MAPPPEPRPRTEEQAQKERVPRAEYMKKYRASRSGQAALSWPPPRNPRLRSTLKRAGLPAGGHDR
jgi:hypothetical protein